jgi:hypothetical protein
MYYIKKYANCWAIHNDDTGVSRSLSPTEVDDCKRALPELTNKATRTYFFDKLPDHQLELLLLPPQDNAYLNIHPQPLR